MADGVLIERVERIIVIVEVSELLDRQLVVIKTRREAYLHAEGRGVDRRLRLDAVLGRARGAGRR